MIGRGPYAVSSLFRQASTGRSLLTAAFNSDDFYRSHVDVRQRSFSLTCRLKWRKQSGFEIYPYLFKILIVGWKKGHVKPIKLRRFASLKQRVPRKPYLFCSPLAFGGSYGVFSGSLRSLTCYHFAFCCWTLWMEGTVECRTSSRI